MPIQNYHAPLTWWSFYKYKVGREGQEFGSKWCKGGEEQSPKLKSPRESFTHTHTHTHTHIYIYIYIFKKYLKIKN